MIFSLYNRQARQQWQRGLKIAALAAACAGMASCSSPKPETLTSYEQPLTSPGAQFAALPPPVQNTIRAQAGAAEIEDISEEQSFGSPVYTINFREALVLPPLVVDARGNVLKPDGTVAVGAAPDLTGVVRGSVANLKPDELPLEVMDTVREQAPGAEIDTAHRELWGERNIYIISFKDPAKNPKLYLLTDGTLMKNSPR